MPLVSICCLAYNHEKYIRDTIEGFLMQKTNFDYEIIIHDDFSKDNTASIIAEYANQYPDKIVFVKQDENMYSKGVQISQDILFPIAKGKYIATCEGDDYWIDSNKLQMQIDYLEDHPKCSATFTGAIILDENGKRKEYFPEVKERDFTLQEILLHDGSLAPTASVVFRKDLIDKVPNYLRVAPIGDLPRMIYLATKGDVHYFDRLTCVYRYNHPGSWSRNHGNRKNLKKYRKGMIAFYSQLLESIPKEYCGIVEGYYQEQMIEYYCETGQIKALKLISKESRQKLPLKTWIRVIIRSFIPQYLIDE